MGEELWPVGSLLDTLGLNVLFWCSKFDEENDSTSQAQLYDSFAGPLSFEFAFSQSLTLASCMVCVRSHNLHLGHHLKTEI